MYQNRNLTYPYLTFLFLAFIFWLPMPLGSNRAWAWSIMELWVFLIAIGTLIMSYRNSMTMPKSLAAAKPVLLLIAAFLLWNCIQIIPLPLDLLAVVSPKAAIIATAAGQVDYASIALDSDLAAKALLKGLAFFTMMVLMLILIDSKKKLKWFAYTILVAGLFQAVYGVCMVLSGVEYTFFIEKEAYRGMATGTFINRNHLAGYLEMVLSIGIGLLISYLSNERANNNWRDRLRRLLDTLLSPKAFIRLSLIIICIALIMTKSRMGNTAFFASLFITGVLFLLTARHATRSTGIFLISLIVLDILLIGSWVGLEQVAERVGNTTMEAEHRDEIASNTLSMLYDFPVTGVGGGNYFTVIPGYQDLDLKRHYFHAHNDYLEFMVEYGAIGFMLLSIAVIYCMLTAYKAMRNRHSALSMGMAFASFMGILSILIHSVVDFNLQIPANAAMFIMLMSLSILSLHLKTQNNR